jgi:hypothetical protein
VSDVRASMNNSCNGCAWLIEMRDGYPSDAALCGHPSSITSAKDRTGSKVHGPRTAVVQRRAGEPCGLPGRLWRQRVPP